MRFTYVNAAKFYQTALFQDCFAILHFALVPDNLEVPIAFTNVFFELILCNFYTSHSANNASQIFGKLHEDILLAAIYADIACTNFVKD
mmetsp:Transcript_7144/g.5409  ORF Transcript_7144/g.5409 Transcript_7144/m.5409 type:complete len:89 (-) Transcript_7144:453-719(-)